MAVWGNFFMAIVNAAAALAGLLFVGVSISLTRILSMASLPGRALEAIVLLLTILIVAALCLVPDQSSFAIGLELLLIGVIVWIITLRIDKGILRGSDPLYKRHNWLNVLLSQLAILPYMLAGTMTLLHGYSGIYWLVPGILFSLIKAVVDAWVLLVEIHR